jgi:enoyl-CoA hydratase/carnithine racemase
MTDVIFEQHGALAIIRLNRPDRLNALGHQMHAELYEAWGRFTSDPEIRVAILTGVGRAFCAGRDIKEQNEGTLGEVFNFPRSPTRLPHYQIPRVDKPTIAAVNGFAIGVGFFMVCGTDLRVASEVAEFGFPELATAVIGPWDLAATQVIPWAVAAELALLGNRISAGRAYEIGLVNRVVPGDQLESAALEYADRLLSMPTQHLAMQMRLMRKVQYRPSPELIDEQDATHTYLSSLEDTAEAARAFVEKRKPQFKGA